MKKSWVQPLQVNEADFHSWQETTPQGESVTFWALSQNKIEESTYLHWAQEHYSLCSLKSDFFAGPPNTELWEKIKEVANWSKELLPLHEWDGVIFIGCVEPPPADLKWSFPTQFVLASAVDLENLWNQFNGSLSHEMPELPDVGDISGETHVGIQSMPSETNIGIPIQSDELKLNTQELSALQDQGEIEDQPSESPALDLPELGEESIVIEGLGDSVETMNSTNDQATPEVESPSANAAEGMEGLNLENLGAQTEGMEGLDLSQAGDISTSTSEEAGEAAPEGMEGLNINLDDLGGTEAQPEENPEGISIEGLSAESESPQGISDVGSSGDAGLNLDHLNIDTGEDQVSTESQPEEASAMLEANAITSESEVSTELPPVPPDELQETMVTTVQPPPEEAMPSGEVQASESKETHGIFYQDDIPTKDIDLNAMNKAIAEEEAAQPLPAPDDEPAAVESPETPSAPETPMDVATATASQNSGVLVKSDMDGGLVNPPVTRDEITNEDEAISFSVNKVREKYEFVMVLKFEGTNIKPWKWTDNWDIHSKKSLEAINIDGPCVFRIVAKTQLPFHGQVASSEINDSFFKAWGFDPPPGAITITPLAIGGQISTLILGVARPNSNPVDQKNLLLMERETTELGNALNRMQVKTAKSA